MENALLGQILNNIVLEKAVRDKMTIQQKQQQMDEESRRAKEADDDLFDEEAEQIFKKMREQRLQQYGKAEQPKPLQDQIGQYREFLNYVTKNKRAVVHFYHEEFQTCQVVHKHLRSIAVKHPQTVFLYIDAKKAPFFVTKLAVKVLPCICVFVNGILKDKIVGFGQLGNSSDFQTISLILKLIVLKMIDELPEQRFKITKGAEKEQLDDDLDID